MFSIELDGGLDRPQMDVLEPHVPVPAPLLRVLAPNRFQFTAQPGLTYQPETRADFVSSGWMDYGAVIVGTGQTATVEMTSTNASRFFRVRAARNQ